MKRLLLSLFFLASVTLNAQVVIYGSESATSGEDWTAGNGFNGWSAQHNGNSGKYDGNPADAGISTTNIGTTAFSFYANDAQYTDAFLQFDEEMQVGEKLTFYWAMNWDTGSGSKGFEIQHSSTSSATKLIEIKNTNSAALEAIHSGSSETAQSNYGTNAMLVTLDRTSNSQYTFSMTARDGSSPTYSTTINSTDAVDQIKIYIGNQASNTERNIFFNHFKITSNSANASVSNDRTLDNLEIENGATLTLSSAGSIQVAGTLTNNGTLKMQSSSSNSAALTSNSISGSGTYTYEKYTASTTTADLISAPFTGETFSDMITNNTNIYTNPSDNTQYLFGPFINSSGSYQNYDSDTDGAETMSSAKGFRAGTYGVATDLFISEYAEGSSNNKYIEIYNGTGSDIDLSNYEIWRIQNGGSWNEGTISLSGTLLSGDVYVIHHSSADATIQAQGDLSSGSVQHNGDDAVGLAKSISGTMTLIDAVGTDGADPGSGWSVAGTSKATKDKTLVRKSTVCSPNTNWSSSAGTNATDSEWIVYAQNTWDYIGSHTSKCSNSLSISGTFQTSNQSINISVGADATNGKWNLIGNPFPTYLDLNHFYSDNSSNFDTTYSALYAYDGDESNGSNWTEYNNANSSGNYIAPGQGFFVASKSGGGTVNFDTDMQSVSGSDDFISGDIMENTEVMLRLLNEDIVKGSTKIIFNENLSLGLDVGWDAGSFSQSAAIMTRLVEDDEGHGLSINAMGLDAMENAVIPLVINQSAGQEFRINLYSNDSRS